ncbi:Tyrosine-protein kinase, catalytic domain [Sesbania bispinosa]|nr:Tyrosine-protein kinase, catalytic domain [Sesbania bispinosa]
MAMHFLDTISPSHFLNYSEALSSSNGFFHLGFFTPQNSTFSYLGIWYMSKPPVVWVANRDQPLNDSSGTVKISEDGNLVLMNGQKEILWSTNVSNISSNTTALLLDTGNLVLQESATGKMVWQSFQHPCNTLLDKMKLVSNKTRMKITSWKSPQDPSIGNFSLSLEHLEIPEVFTWRGSQLYWRSGPWNAQADNRDGFLKLQNTKVPDFVQWSSSLYDDCRTQCLQNCSCLAYAYDAGIGCMLWSGDLIDIQRFSAGGTDLYIRVPYSELDEKKKSATVIIAVTVTIGTIIILTCGYVLWKRNTKREKINLKIQSHRSQVNDPSKFKLPELSQFEFEKIATATNNFHLNNKLGQGGFGPVYKGTLEDGQEIAVKRLSRTSGQGLEEFMNETWYGKDFGHSEDEANTRRVVGTYGYLSPEYAMEGLFSEKSDVFSFGVLLLEIVSRRKNTSFYKDAETLSLLGFAWKLWNEDNITSLIDPEISNQSFHADIIRCIHIGLLCVQELARDRPTMTTVISMLSNETVYLPTPRRPAFIQRQTMLDVECSPKNDVLCSINYVSVTNFEGR